MDGFFRENIERAEGGTPEGYDAESSARGSFCCATGASTGVRRGSETLLSAKEPNPFVGME
jgi:hypothetical protein